MKKEITIEEWDNICQKADKEMKESKGHQFLTILKTRCQLCGRSPQQKGKCRYWMKTYLDRLYFGVNDFLREEKIENN